MGSIGLVEAVIEARKTWEHLEYRNKKETVLLIDSFGLLTTRQIGDALGLSHTAVQYHLKGVDVERLTRGGYIIWSEAEHILEWLNGAEHGGVFAFTGSNKWALEHLWNNK